MTRLGVKLTPRAIDIGIEVKGGHQESPFSVKTGREEL